MPCMTQIKIMNTEKQIYEKYDKEEGCRPSWVGGPGLEIGHIPIKKYSHRKYRQKFHFDL